VAEVADGGAVNGDGFTHIQNELTIIITSISDKTPFNTHSLSPEVIPRSIVIGNNNIQWFYC
jgi:hypothetical protein